LEHKPPRKFASLDDVRDGDTIIIDLHPEEEHVLYLGGEKNETSLLFEDRRPRQAFKKYCAHKNTDQLKTFFSEKVKNAGFKVETVIEESHLLVMKFLKAK
jgi:hypothetical protein